MVALARKPRREPCSLFLDSPMRDFRGSGSYKDIVEVPSPDDFDVNVRLGLRARTLQQYTARNLRTAVAHYYGIVQSELASAQHLFMGVKRPMLDGEDMHADQRVFDI